MTNCDLSQECKVGSTYKSQSMQYTINRIKDKSIMIISIDTEKTSGKIQHPFMLKTLNKPVTEGNFHNLRKSIYEKPTPNINTSHKTRKKAESIPFKIRNKLGCLHLPFLFNIALGVLSKSNLTRKTLDKSQLRYLLQSI